MAENIGEALKQKDTFHIIAIRSTIMPGTCDKFADIVERISGKKRNEDFAIVDNPEFLREEQLYMIITIHLSHLLVQTTG